MNTPLRRPPRPSFSFDDASEQVPSLFQEQVITQMNHQLRTPLTVVLGSLELLRDQKELLDAETQAVLLTQAVCACEQLESFISSILALLEVDKSAYVPQSERPLVKEEVHLE